MILAKVPASIGRGARGLAPPESGFGSIEAIVAVTLLSMIATGLCSTLAYARRVQKDTAMQRQAMHLATSAMERLQAGEVPVPVDDPPGFTTQTFVTASPGLTRLLEARVEVRWQAEQLQKLVLRTLILR